jgi:superfamily I DNA and/or RNA helicase
MVLTKKHVEILINTKNKYLTFFDKIKGKYKLNIQQLYIGTVLYSELSDNEFELEMDFMELDNYL